MQLVLTESRHAVDYAPQGCMGVPLLEPPNEHLKYLSKVLHNTQKSGIIHHLAEEAG
jgi:hypothetical protein